MSLNILGNIASASGKKAKFEILENNSSNKELADLLDATFNFRRRFFVNKFSMPSAVNDEDTQHKHAEFSSMLNLLETRQLTGNAAKDAVERFFGTCNTQQQEWYSKVLRKDLKAGFSAKTAVKAGFKSIPLFDLKLAKDKDDCKKLTSLLKAGGYRSIKYDGYRLVAEIVDGCCTLRTRKGLVYENFPMINKALEELFPTGKHMLDGEMMSDDFQSMQKSAFAKKRGNVVGDMIFRIFDSVPWDEWESKKFKKKASERFKDLEAWYKANPHKLIAIVEHEWGVWTEEEMIEYRDKQIVAGHEGGMWEPDIPYYLGKKSNKMIKFKLMLSQDCEIIGHFLGKIGTRLEGKLGGFIVKQENGLECRVGSGFSDEDRDHMALDPEALYNKCMEIKYQELTSDGVMRFPIFYRWRKDKDAF